MKTKDIALAILVVAIWGVSFSVIKVGLQELPPLLLSALRFLIAANPAVFFIPFPKTTVVTVVMIGLLLGVIKFSLLFLALNGYVSAGIASLLLQLQVFFTIVLSAVLLKESVSRFQLTGMLISLIGFGFFIFLQQGSVTTTGVILISLAALAWALSNLVMKKNAGVNVFHLMVWACLIPPLPLMLLSVLFESPQPWHLLTDVSLKVWFSLLFLAFAATLLAYALWGYLLARFTAATITPFALLIPIVGISTSAVILGERLHLLEILSALIVMAGLVLCVLGERLHIMQKWQTGSSHSRQSQ
ncbi:EamA family transporter [Marinicella sp. W31]|uniref:EamA family transporter n=1 Tax=Marinicella sp. W31 TaxID=3023713 RepID=UPI003756EB1E